MYDFIDVSGVATNSLPSEAMQLNGVYLENVIPGYQTLHTSGREFIPVEISEFTNGIRDGAMYRSKRRTPRTITVQFQLVAATSEGFRAAFDKLNAYLDVENAKIIFDDEDDKYYIGTPSALEEVPPGRNAITASFSIYCTDPFKYSIQEYTASPVDGLITIDNYGGTYKAFPVIAASFPSDCGYIGLVDSDGHIIQIGDPDEVDDNGEEVKSSETLIDVDFSKSGASLTGWTPNNAKPKDSTYVQQGSAALRQDLGVYPSNYGNNTTTWHGPSITKQIPADSSGAVGAKNFTLSFRQEMTYTLKQKGEIQIIVNGKDQSGNDKHICEIHIYKRAVGTNEIRGICTVGDDNQNSIPYKNNTNCKSSNSISKFGSKFTFSLFGKKYEFTNEELADCYATEVSIFLEKYKNVANVSQNACRWIKFIKHDVTNWNSIPNKFSAGDEMIADCKEGAIYVNDIPVYGLGALGNDWEQFVLKKGANVIQCLSSEWAEEAPEIELRYREVFL